MKRSLSGALVTNVLEPLSDQPSSTRRRGGPQREGVRARFRLGHPVRGDQRAVAQARELAALLLLGAEVGRSAARTAHIWALSEKISPLSGQP